MNKLPYLTTHLPGIGGQIKTVPDDFHVEEIPLYQPSGEGDHVYLWIEKRGITTFQAINQIARALNISSRKIGYAGLKDAQAVTQQMLSIENVSPEQVTVLSLPKITILSVKRHKNKLKLGHLSGNKFRVKIRQTEQKSLSKVEVISDYLLKHGIPNYFGQQRFGYRNNSHRLGFALMQNNNTEFLAEYLGHPQPHETPQIQHARSAYDANDLDKALKLWSAVPSSEKSALQTLIRTEDESKAVNSINKRLRRLFFSASQSHFFNILLTQRLPTLDKLEFGDVAYIHHNGACFIVDNPDDEQARADIFEISPTGPLFGKKCLAAQGEPGRREMSVLKLANFELKNFAVPSLKLKGGRRPYRIQFSNVHVDWDNCVVISFAVPAGGYATMVLREFMKTN